jgi:hypothetical protein
MYLAIVAAASILAVPPGESQMAFAHRATLPADVAPYAWYLSLSDVPPEQQFKLQAAVELMVPSLCHKPFLPPQVPQRVEGTPLMYINSAELGWSGHYEKGIQQHYPYRPDVTRYGKVPICVSALWFVSQVPDQVETGDFSFQLLYSGKPPKTLDEYLAFWRAGKESQLFLGLVGGGEGTPSVVGRRTIENRPVGNRGFMWGTKDTKKLSLKTDPLENLVPGKVQFDASEWLGAIPKYQSGRSGALMSQFLADAKGKAQTKAPADVVVDYHHTRGAEIRYVSCISCHANGINEPQLDEYKEYIVNGARIRTYDRATKEQIEAYLEGDFGKEIRRANEDYAAGVDMACGYPAPVAAGFFVEQVKRYDVDVTLEQAAREWGCTPEEASLGIAWANERGYKMSARMAELPHGVAMPRDRFEQEGYLGQTYVQQFKGK